MTGASLGRHLLEHPSPWQKIVSRHGVLSVLVGLALCYLSTNWLPLVVGMPELTVYVVQPLAWGGLGYLCLSLWYRDAQGHGLPCNRWPVTVALLLGGFQIAIFCLAGLLAGFGRSPYAHAPLLILLNIWYVTALLFGMEAARFYLVTHLARRSVLLGCGLGWLVLWLVSLPLLSVPARLLQSDAAFDFVGRLVLPEAGESLLATYLVFVGGPLPALAYRGLLAAFEWTSPVLPNLPWTLHAFLGTVVPAVSVLLARDLLQPAATEEQVSKAAGRNDTAWVLSIVLIVTLFWFNTGLFGVRPALITGHSMEPSMYLGDIAITRPVKSSEVQVGDVVRYRTANASILHRVTSVKWDQGVATIATKGDNNDVPDPAWDASQLEGELVAVVPKIGWVLIWLHGLLDVIL